MTWESIAQTWSVLEWILNSYNNIISYEWKIQLISWIVISLIIWICFFVFKKNKNLSVFWALKKSIPWISITFVITYILSQFIWKTPDFNNLLAILMYFWCVWVATTLFFWAAFYATASMDWKPNPQKIAIEKSWPIWFVVITVFLIFSLLIHIIMELIN